ncbi:MAG: NADH-quinone oxidoreductase subunit C [Gammaproteobacteria bacterium]|nr:NADH-quinone oxidoreductase subunit C [Gammaproteobacteria bacterium]
MSRLAATAQALESRIGARARRLPSLAGELAIEVTPELLVPVCRDLRDMPELAFEQLTDLSGIDYLEFGRSEWVTEAATSSGFSRGVERQDAPPLQGGPRFAVAYHLLSVSRNMRLRVRCNCAPGEPPILDTVTDVWASAAWYEREAFDLFGILFRGHPDLRRILTDYGFIGHPFRKDFPLIGNVEVRYDPAKGRVVYEPVSIEPRVTVPKVIRRERLRVDAPAGQKRDG